MDLTHQFEEKERNETPVGYPSYSTQHWLRVLTRELFTKEKT